MSELRLSIGNYAQTPFYLNSVGTNVYCIEELCYLFALNPFMIAPTIMTEGLSEWLETECGLKSLSDGLNNIVKKRGNIRDYVNHILDFAGICSEEDRKIINDTLENNIGLSDIERRKAQADYILKSGRCEAAIEEYERILGEVPEFDTNVRTKIYKNIGYAYAQLFMFELSARYYKRVFDMTKDVDAAIMYLSAVRMYLREDKYLKFLGENPQFHDVSLLVEKKINGAFSEYEGSEEKRMLTTLEIYRGEGNVSSYYNTIDDIIFDMKENYIKQVAN